MSESTPAPEAPAESTWTPPASQQELNRIIGDRVARAKAPYADYDDLKAQVEGLAAIEERATKAEAEVATLPTKVAEALRTYLVGLHEIPDEDADLFLTAQDPETLVKQVQRLTARQGGVKPSGNHVPREGTPTASAADPAREAVRGLFG